MTGGQAPLVHGLCAGFPWGSLYLTTERPAAAALPAGSSPLPAVAAVRRPAAARTSESSTFQLKNVDLLISVLSTFLGLFDIYVDRKISVLKSSFF